ncbi:hypothetical protein H6P81_015930 [Aristolochia fimbriata]|uniref:Phosphatidic acid phosphatase type 2/haloperoxidase domain-containing protein n=1 Tax=Aristolochia fimbriata TaxID=158543 RepID=A0AAV7E6T7_ARIFI|nr:hypothetical protein H6P81_015930 [Aristolochia fimbriata]
MVLAASGVDHEHLMEIAEPLLYDLTTGPSMSEPSSVYVGGDFRHKADSDKTHVALAFEVPGGWRQDFDSTVLTVLQTLMGGGGSFSSGGSGKGMHSRLYLRVLNHHQEADSFSAFSYVHNDSGLFDIYLVTVSHLLRMYLKLIDSEGLSVVGDCYSWASYGVGAASGKECYQICCFNELGIQGMMKSLDFAIHVYHNVTGDVICHGDKSVIKEGHKSFPSGHASWCFAGLAFLALYLSALVGVSRVDDYWHHWQDVFAGGLLGRLIVVAFNSFHPFVFFQLHSLTTLMFCSCNRLGTLCLFPGFGRGTFKCPAK